MSEHHCHWLFGYGSIVNEESRLRTLAAHSQDAPPPAAWVELSSGAGFVREWNFRAPSGFQAVGLRRVPEDASAIGGVLFEAGGDDALRSFDLREAGYERVELDPSLITVIDEQARVEQGAVTTSAILGREQQQQQEEEEQQQQQPPQERHRRYRCRNRFWTYVPVETSCASEDNPICQTYIDTCLLGCLERGKSAGEGRDLAVRWLLTTGSWSRFLLNDAPMSRRPWLHRPRHAEIDAICREHEAHTLFDERRHPEEFSGRWMGSLRGVLP